MRVVWLGAALAAFLSAWLAALNLELDSGVRPIVQLVRPTHPANYVSLAAAVNQSVLNVMNNTII
jgi:hypothetical protein